MSKNGWGGRREGGGRPKKSDESKLIERLDNIIDQDKAIDALNSLIQKKDIKAIRLYFEYRYGKPNQKVDVTTDGERLNDFNLANLTDEQLKVVLKLYEGQHPNTN